MFRKMRRSRQQMTESECIDILRNGTSGVLAVNGDEGFPYAVPLNYFYEDGHIYFHSAKSGHKIDAIRRCSKASFCVVGTERNVPEEFTTYFKSVIAFGNAVIVDDEDEKRSAVTKLAEKYSPDEPREKLEAEISRFWDALAMIRLDIVHMTGKQAVELIK